jgi:beta-lactamase superfamily II metal-dependent hydrolase
MATRKKAAQKTAVKKSRKPTQATPSGRAARTAPATGKAVQPNSAQAGAVGNGNIRIRMYRIGFGDFFLMTVPGKNGPAHVLIDCGVHAANIGTIGECVQDMAQVTGKNLALVILTHYHADHMSGFATCYDDFTEFTVGAVWITNRLDPDKFDASKFMMQLTNVAQQLKMQLGARKDEAGVEAQFKVENALGVASENGGGGSNAKALQLLRSGFKNKPPVYYYQGGDTPTLPDELEGMIAAEILAPSPKNSDGEFAASDNKTEQYLAALGDNGVPDTTRIQPFDRKKWPGSAKEYPKQAFDEFDGSGRMESKLGDMQPDALAAAADKLDGTLNNQSLVVLFTCNGKKLLFVGDAQWGNWAYWLYGKAVTGSDPGISDRAKEILGAIDFYKVGHHGSTNATPIPVVDALNQQCAAMCSTATGAYGSQAKKTEVPRTALMEALEKRTGERLVRSDWVSAGENKPDDQAREELPALPSGFTSPNEGLYIDYNL